MGSSFEIANNILKTLTPLNLYYIYQYKENINLILTIKQNQILFIKINM